MYKETINTKKFILDEEDYTHGEIPCNLDSRRGMTVSELIKELENVEDKDRYVACPEKGFGGISGVLNIEETEVGLYAGSYSFQKIPIVVLWN